MTRFVAVCRVLYIPILLMLTILPVGGVRAQRTVDPAQAEPLPTILSRVEGRFGVRIVCKRFDPDTLQLAAADFRIRPYSLTETLDNLLRPLDLVWSGDSTRVVVQPYEYYRRTPSDGAKLLAWLSSQYDDRQSWEQRRWEILDGVRRALDLAPFCAALTPNPQVQLGKVCRHKGYSTQNYALETLQGLYVCGTIYAPLTRGKHPLILSPAGHWPQGRYRDDQQYRMATFARMGAVAVDLDIFGWGDSERQIGREAHTQSYAMQMQVLWSKQVADYLVHSRRDLDTTRMAATGGSGGATHTLLLAAVDPRFRVLAPVVHLVSHFDGGCPCESGRAVTLAAGGTCMPEILAAVAAPNPLLVVSDGGDWTASYPTLEYPFLRRIWGFYEAADAVENAHFATEKHDYGIHKRCAVYDFFARTLQLDRSQADESQVEILSPEALQSFGDALPDGAIRSRQELERQLKTLK